MCRLASGAVSLSKKKVYAGFTSSVRSVCLVDGIAYLLTRSLGPCAALLVSRIFCSSGYILWCAFGFGATCSHLRYFRRVALVGQDNPERSDVCVEDASGFGLHLKFLVFEWVLLLEQVAPLVDHKPLGDCLAAEARMST